MAGEGQRFVNAGYNTPKPLIENDGLPMVVQAAKTLPPAEVVGCPLNLYVVPLVKPCPGAVTFIIPEDAE